MGRCRVSGIRGLEAEEIHGEPMDVGEEGCAFAGELFPPARFELFAQRGPIEAFDDVEEWLEEGEVSSRP